MQLWEYTWLRIKVYGNLESPGQYDIEELDELGRNGWEAFARSEYPGFIVFHLKRANG